MNPYATDLKIPFPPFKDDAHPQDIYKTLDLMNRRIVKHYIEIPVADLNPDVHQWMADVAGLEIYLAEFFSKFPYPSRGMNRIHRGGAFVADKTKINWVWGGDDSFMTWYEQMGPGVPTPVGNSQDSIITYFPDLEAANAKPIYKHRLIYPTACLVQVAVPHAVENYKKPRWALTTIARDIRTKNNLPYAEMYERLKSVAVIV